MKRSFAIFALFAFSFAMNACDSNSEVGTMTDSRDGQTYKTVKIGDQVWMAENLKVKTEDSWCYADKESNCEKYGRLYSWGAAMEACPSGWRLPSYAEFETLIDTVGGEKKASKKLKSTSGWNHGGNGSDAYSFSALPAGGRYGDRNYHNAGDEADFWSSTEYGSDRARFLLLFFVHDRADLVDNYKRNGLSVRCIKDTVAEESVHKISSGGMLKDKDDNVYKTVKIGDQVWMAENLKVKTTDSWCYYNKESHCQKYGRLYAWNAALEACPSGWHLPSKSEFEALFNAVGGKSEAGKMLKAKIWNNSISGGTNAYSFSALPAGIWNNSSEYFLNEGDRAYFWSSTEKGSFSAYYMHLYPGSAEAFLDDNGKSFGVSVRCVKD